MDAPSCAEQAKKSHLPFLLLHGKKDEFVPTNCSVRLAEELGDKARLVLFDDAAHAEAIFYNKELYKKELLEFLSKYMTKS
jgi:pimeloyl-ACP methyl ester carboxylesterase